MYCSNCGNKILGSDKFCSTCGFGLDRQRLNNDNNINNVSNKTNGLALASLIIGAASLMFVSFAPITLIAAIIGLILGIACKNKCTEKKVGIILNIIGIVLGFFITLIWILFFIGVASDIEDDIDDKVPVIDQNVFGVWDCTKETYGDFNEKYYIISLYLNKDLTFKWQNYNNELSDYYYGEYSYSVLSRRNNDYGYFLLQFIGMSHDKNDKPLGESFNKSYTLDIDFEEEEAVLKRVDSNEKYICSYKIGSVSGV